MAFEEKEKYAVRSVLNDPGEPEKTGKRRKSQSRTPLEKAKKWAMDYLARPHSEKELREKLREKGCSPEDIDTVCALCIDYGFLNDGEYAATIVRHYAGRGYGAGRIRMELSRRGIDKSLWDGAFLEMPEDTDTIDRVLASRLRGRDITDRKERDKAANALFRRGFSWDEIRAAMRRYGQDDDE